MVQAEVGEAERKMHQARLLFEDVGRLLKGELERFDKEKVEDFKAGVETWLESSVEAQKEVSHILYPSVMTRLLTFEAHRDLGDLLNATRPRGRGRATGCRGARACVWSATALRGATT